MHDQPQKPLERAVYWVEYVLRHKGAYHLRSSALDLAWYQYLLLDVVAFLGVITLVSLAITFLVVRKLFCSFFCKKKQAKKTAQSKKKNQ